MDGWMDKCLDNKLYGRMVMDLGMNGVTDGCMIRQY